MANRSRSDKKLHGPPEDKLARDLGTLTRTANLDENAGADNGRRSVCFNAACPDYRRERRSGEACGCRRRRIT